MINTPLSQAADALEQAYLDVANGVVKPNKMPLEPLVRAVQAMRAQEPNWIDAKKEKPADYTKVLVRGEWLGYTKHDVAEIKHGVWISSATLDECGFDVKHWMVIPL